MYIYTYIHTYTHTHVRIYIYTYIHISIHIYRYIFKYIQMYKYTYIDILGSKHSLQSRWKTWEQEYIFIFGDFKGFPSIIMVHGTRYSQKLS